MIKNQILRRWLSILTAFLVSIQPVMLLARGGGRGGGGGGGGGFRGGGGGGGFQGGGGGNFGGHSPSFSGGGGGARPGGGGGGARPAGGGGGAARPAAGGGAARPAIGSGTARPGAGGVAGNPFSGGNRPQVGNNAGNRGQVANRANNVGNRANNIGNRANTLNRPNYNNNWHHGNWNGNWNHGHVGGWWGGYGFAGHPWARATAWGLTAWAIGSIFYDSGYSEGGGDGGGGGDYSNPYYPADSSGSEYNYGQPIPTDYQAAAAAEDPYAPPPQTPEVKERVAHSDLSREAFKKGDYAKALTEVDLALKKLPSDAALHEFRALVFFAQQKYSDAAGVLYAVLSAGPGWDWTTLSSMYPSTEAYTGQLRTLEQYSRANKDSAEAHFVLAYQYITCGHNDAAIRELKEVLRLQPKDQLSTKLLTMMGGSTAAATSPAATDAATTPALNFPDVDAAKLVGDWTADRAKDNSKFSLKLTADKKFTWSFSKAAKKNEFGGTYSMDGAVLVLQRTDGGTMPGLVTLGGSGFNYKLYGGPPEDKGLDFKK